MVFRKEQLVPVDTSAALSKGSFLKWDATNHHYVADDGTAPEAVLMEDVAAGQTPAYALALVGGDVYEDEIAVSVTEDMKALLRKVGIYVEKRESVNVG